MKNLKLRFTIKSEVQKPILTTILAFLLFTSVCFAQHTRLVLESENDTAQIRSHVEKLQEKCVKTYYEEGYIKSKDTIIDGDLVRLEYNYCGTITAKSRLTTEAKKDTLILFISSLSEEHIMVNKYSANIINGRSIQYHGNGKVKEEGIIRNEKKISNWKEYYPNGDIKRDLNYNKKGKLKGSYTAYYKDNIVKLTGEYDLKIIYIDKDRFDPETYEMDSSTEPVEVEVKKGTWKYYSYQGYLLRTETFK